MTTKKEVLHNEKNEIVLAETYGTFYEQLEKQEASHKDAVFDISTNKGEKDARSFVYNLRRSKAPVKDAHKIAKAEAKALCDALDAGKRDIIGRIDNMIECHEKPIKEKEEAEKKRVEEINARIGEINTYLMGLPQPIGVLLSDAYKERLQRLLQIKVDDSFMEFEDQAHQAFKAAKESLETKIEDHLKQEAEAAELKRLREQQEIQERKEREARIAKEAAQRAEAEAKAKQEQLEREKQEAAERHEREKREATEKAEREKQAAVEAERKRSEAEQREAQRKEQERQRQEQARVDNEQHRAQIHANIHMLFLSYGLTEEWAKFLTDKITNGEIPELQVKY